MDQNKNCMNCAYGGCHNIRNKWYSCDNTNNADRFLIEDSVLPVAYGINEDYAKTCKYFIPHIEIDRSDLEIESHVNVSHTCPYCGNEDIIYAADYEGEELIVCENCGMSYKISWCLD